MDLNQIAKFFPTSLHGEGESLLREYLQYEMLRAIFESKYAHQYTFLGGTCLRIAYGTQRFSEDLDFDNEGLTQGEFEETANYIKYRLELLGFNVRLKFTYRGAFHCKVTFPALLFDYELSGHKEASMFIKLDTEKQHYNYEPQLHRLDKFDVTTDIRVTPLSLLASQKIAAIMGRKRPKGRDFYDLRWVLVKVMPDYGYLTQKLNISTSDQLRKAVSDRIEPFDFTALTRDVAQFLMSMDDAHMVQTFPTYWQTVKLD